MQLTVDTNSNLEYLVYSINILKMYMKASKRSH